MSIPAAVYRPRNPQLSDYFCLFDFDDVSVIFVNDSHVLERLFCRGGRHLYRYDLQLHMPRQGRVLLQKKEKIRRQ